MAPETKNFYALLVGVGSYVHPGYADLPATARDVRALADTLKDPGRCAYPSGNVCLISGEEADAANLRDALRDLAGQTTADTTVLIYFSGHGGRAVEDGHWRTYICPREADPDNLPHTAISGDEFSHTLATVAARRMTVVLDACHAGGSAEFKAAENPTWKSGLPDAYYEALAQGSGRVIIASSKAEQYSYVRGELSLFTHHFIQALDGRAAIRGDGYIRVLDVFHYVNERVQQEQPNQVPLLKVKDLDLNFAIALDRGGKGAGAGPAVPSGLVAIREQIVRDPPAGARALSDYLAGRSEWAVKRNEVDLRRSELERIQYELDLFGPDDNNKAARNRIVFSLLRICLELAE